MRAPFSSLGPLLLLSYSLCFVLVFLGFPADLSVRMAFDRRQPNDNWLPFPPMGAARPADGPTNISFLFLSDFFVSISVLFHYVSARLLLLLLLSFFLSVFLSFFLSPSLRLLVGRLSTIVHDDRLPLNKCARRPNCDPLVATTKKNKNAKRNRAPIRTLRIRDGRRIPL